MIAQERLWLFFPTLNGTLLHLSYKPFIGGVRRAHVSETFEKLHIAIPKGSERSVHNHYTVKLIGAETFSQSLKEELVARKFL